MTTDITGSEFNRWRVLSFDHSDKSGKMYFMCQCECGTKAIVRKDQLTREISKSCGCWKREVASKQIIALSTTHGMANKTRTYGIWKGIHKRCNNPKDKNYKNYGGRGITVCERWKNYALFLADMGEIPHGLTIDRKDNNGNYEPDNCKWSTVKEQMNNMRSNVYLRHEGELLTVHQIADKVGIPYHRLYQRLFKLHWPIYKAVSK